MMIIIFRFLLHNWLWAQDLSTITNRSWEQINNHFLNSINLLVIQIVIKILFKGTLKMQKIGRVIISISSSYCYATHYLQQIR